MVVVLAVALLTQLASVAGALATGGWVWSFKPLMPDVSRLNPLKGITQLLAPRKLMDVVKMVLLTSVLTLIAYQFLSSHLLSMAGLVMQPSVMALHTLLGWLTQGLGYTLLALLLVTLIDVPLQIFLHKSDMKMTRQEVKDEHKDSEGNPQLKGRLRQRQREMAQGRSISAVPKADFVVMNPTHFAVAIRYDEATMAAPVVISMGADLLAMKIRDVARSHEVPVIESPMLARALYANSDIGQDIPAALYSAVAQVLAYVYRLKAALRGEAPMPEQLEPPLVPPELDPYGPHTEAQA
jgi:flagellar biosynthetic protein FlhB